MIFKIFDDVLLAGGEGEGECWDAVNEADVVVNGGLALELGGAKLGGAELGGAEFLGEGVGDEEAGTEDGFVVGALGVEGGDALGLVAGDLEGDVVGDAVEYGGGDEVVGVLVAGKGGLLVMLCAGGGLGVVEVVVEVGVGDGGVGLEGGEVGDEAGVDVGSVLVDDVEVEDDDGGLLVVA